MPPKAFLSGSCLAFSCPLALPPSVLESEVLGLCHYDVQPTPVLWHGACGQEWTAGRLQLPQPGYLGSTMELGGKENQHPGKVTLQWPTKWWNIPNMPQMASSLADSFLRAMPTAGPCPQPCRARVSCPLHCILSQRREELALVSTAGVEEGAVPCMLHDWQ